MALKPMLQKVESLMRGRVYGLVVVVFQTVEIAKELSYETYKRKKLILFLHIWVA